MILRTCNTLAPETRPSRHAHQGPRVSRRPNASTRSPTCHSFCAAFRFRWQMLRSTVLMQLRLRIRCTDHFQCPCLPVVADRAETRPCGVQLNQTSAMSDPLYSCQCPENQGCPRLHQRINQQMPDITTAVSARDALDRPSFLRMKCFGRVILIKQSDFVMNFEGRSVPDTHRLSEILRSTALMGITLDTRSIKSRKLGANITNTVLQPCG